MAYDVSALSNYTKDNGDILLLKSLFEGKTADIIRSKGQVMSEVKSSERINQIDTDAVFQAGSTCGFNASGTTTLSARTITVGSVKVHEALCPKDLEAKAAQQKLKAGTANGQKPFEQEYTDLKAGIISEQIETAIWQGDTGSGNANLSKWDGLIKIIDAAGATFSAGAVPSNVKTLSGTVTVGTGATSVTGSGTAFDTELAAGDKIYNLSGVLVGTIASVTNATAAVLTANGAVAVSGAAVRSYTVAAQAANGGAASPVLASAGITASNVMQILKAMKNSLPVRVKGKSDVMFFCGWDVFDMIVDAHVTANYFNYGQSSIKDGEFVIPGTTYKVTAVNGLNGTSRLFALRASNLVLGTDLDGEESKYEIFWAKEAMQTRFVCEFKYGVQVVFPNEIVQFRGA